MRVKLFNVAIVIAALLAPVAWYVAIRAGPPTQESQRTYGCFPFGLHFYGEEYRICPNCLRRHIQPKTQISHWNVGSHGLRRR